MITIFFSHPGIDIFGLDFVIIVILHLFLGRGSIQVLPYIISPKTAPFTGGKGALYPTNDFEHKMRYFPFLLHFYVPAVTKYLELITSYFLNFIQIMEYGPAFK